MAVPLLVPLARLERSADGTPWSKDFQDIYHSSQGGLAQARHVFLGGNGLPERWQDRDAFTIVETGFGLGLNFLAAWDAWRTDRARPRRLNFVSVESTPFGKDDLLEALAPVAELEPLAHALGQSWPLPFAGLHRLHFEGGRVSLTLAFGDAQAMLPQVVARADAFFLDGFSPARNPALWSPSVVRELARLAAPDATLATWTVAGGVRTALADAGFTVEKRQGFGAKREMLAGRREGPPSTVRRDRRAIVVGGGLSGTLVAERLALRSWEVEILDARPERSVAAVGLLRPVVNLRDALNAQISRFAFFYALQHFRGLQQDGFHILWDRCGVLQLAEDPEEAQRFRAIVGAHAFPPEFLEYVDEARAEALAGRPVRGGGWWFPSGAWISPGSLAVASLAKAEAQVRRHTGRRVAKAEHFDGLWHALDADGAPLAEAPTMVVANAADARRLCPEARLPLSNVRGQVTYVPAAPARKLDIVVSGSGYLAPRPDGEGHVIGASYQHDDLQSIVRAADHRENLLRAESMLPGWTEGLHPMNLEGWTGFRATVPDRLPIFGAGSIAGQHFATGLGSRGLLWAPLGAELIASVLEEDPLPLLRDQAGAISPRRFLS